MNTPIFAANWKCNLDLEQVQKFIPWMETLDGRSGHVILFGSTCYLAALTPLSKSDLWIGAQDVSIMERGAFTGEVAAFQLKSMGVKIVLVGHSERRHVFGEDNNTLSKKLDQLRRADIPACFCVGETLEQRQSGQTLGIIQEQLVVFLKAMRRADSKSEFFSQSLLAYEPVWAIGTGNNATTQDIEVTHTAIKSELKNKGLSHIPVLYGGSVKGANAREILKTAGVDGVLVGGASNEPGTFDEIRLSSR